ncbi:Gfo/Idh/MocA family oxidoreductase [Emticicia sp. CRIBPO]|jgi:predicted dehydrogenase|uniref:Gfo/Idh/MocA family protein n=1 Tax=Emticicia sp. CRIBPO TaxID=2683258 RepID=UPI001411E718|nr:Gfo/Idh/MocA family oxidoreductase [Emticicia sp. CRIBPO]NBA85677.1 Gfo/Idh/MocA family oxidoreductase [Emticicia sp. CRIBPO]
MEKQTPDNSRRDFIKTGLFAAGSFFIVPRHVLGKGFKAPSDKLNLASIGAGGKGFGDISNAWNNGAENVVALCDVDTNQAARAIKKFPNAKVFSDFRVMFEQMKGDIDAVTISTPDHVHGIAAMTAMQAGKHVYVQKPLTHNIYETRQLTEAARKYKLVTQMGNQGASNPGQQQMIEWFNKGLIGTVDTVYVWTNRPVWPQGIPVPTGKPELPPSMSKENWDLFIGPADYVDYHPLYHPFKWRGWWNFGTGALGDMGCHLIDPPFRVLELGYPTEVECSVGQVFTKDWQPEFIPEGCPPSSHVQLKFPASKKNKKEIKMIWSDGGIRPFHPDLIPADESIGEEGSANGVMMIGSKGIMTCGTYGLVPKVYLNKGGKLEMPKDYKTKNKNETLPEYGHQTSWVEAIKDGFGNSKHKALTSSFDYSGPLTETVLMGNLAIRSYGLRTAAGNGFKYDGRKKLLWDGTNMKITNFDDANQFVNRNYREGWKLI